MDLAQKKCVACEGFETPFDREEAEVLLKELNGSPDANGSGSRHSPAGESSGVKDWKLSDDAKNISKDLKFKNFADALAFTNKIGALAEEEGHHPDIELSWGRVGVSLTTHAIKGLSENDFILAAKVDQLRV